MRKRILNVPVWLWLIFFAVSAVFLLVPEIDVWFAGLFYRSGAGFELRGVWFERLLYRSVGVLLIGGNVLLVALWLVNRFTKWQTLRLSGRQLLFVLLLLALGPGLIVNTTLKENWGRARPVDLEQFGGDRQFSPAFLPSDQGGGSFSSGHAAGAFFWVVVASLASRRRGWWMGLALAYGLLVSLGRMAAGAHFLSDVVVSFFVVVIVGLMLHGLIFGTSRPGTPPSRAQGA